MTCRKQMLSAAMAVAMVVTMAACGTAGGSKTQEQQRLEATTQAMALINRAPDVIWLYNNEIQYDREAEPYRTEGGAYYYPVTQFRSWEELQQYSRQVFTQDFCQTQLYQVALDRMPPKFIEREGGLWFTPAGGMGWLHSLIPGTEELVEYGDDRIKISAFSQSLLGTISREEFLLLREKDGWRLDNYYHMNRTDEPDILPTLMELINQTGVASPLEQLAITTPGGSPATISQPEYCGPFQAMLAALEYTPGTEISLSQTPDSLTAGHVARMEMAGGMAACCIWLDRDGGVVLEAPDGSVTGVQLAYPGGLELLTKLIGAMKWSTKQF